MKKLRWLLMAAWIILIPVQDSLLQGTPLGVLGASPAFLALLGMIVLDTLILASTWTQKTIRIKYIFLIVYIAIINLVYLALARDMNSHGTNIVVKMVTLGILTLFSFYPVFFLDYSAPKIGTFIKIAFGISVFGVILVDALGMDGAGSLLHFTENLNMRPRGLTMESSHLACMAITMGLLSAHYSKTRAGAVMAITAMIGMVAFSMSKGGLLGLAFLGFVLMLLYLKKNKKALLILVPVWAVVSSVVISIAVRSIGVDLQEYTSGVTRSVLVVTSVISTLHNPLGVGFSGFLPAVDRYADMAYDLMNRISPMNLNFGEIAQYLMSDNDFGITTKTMLFDFMMFYGIPFLVAFSIFNKRLLQRLDWKKNIYLYLALAYSLLAICFYVNPVGFYNVSLVYGIAFYEAYRKKTAPRGI